MFEAFGVKIGVLVEEELWGNGVVKGDGGGEGGSPSVCIGIS
jgi:hypothetical protein